MDKIKSGRAAKLHINKRRILPLGKAVIVYFYFYSRLNAGNCNNMSGNVSHRNISHGKILTDDFVVANSK